MTTFKVTDMTCGHCASTITKAVRAVDALARIEVDVAGRLVHIEPADADAQALSKAISSAGYSAVEMDVSRESTPARAMGCCCGGGASTCRS